MKTRLTTLLGIEYPIIQGAMAWIADSSLAGAVSAAGGLGVIAAGNAPVDIIRNYIREVKARTDRPFALNIMLMSPTAEDIVQLALDERVPAVTTGAGNPAQYMAAFKERGIIVMPVVPTVALAVRMERFGADAVIAEGCEAGGHIGEMTTMALTPQVADAVKIPVAAAGGIADGRGLAAALMLGASGVQMGTRFILADECTAHDNYKQKILDAADTSTMVTGRTTGHPMRALKNRFTRAFKELEDAGASKEACEQFGTGKTALAVRGDMDNGSILAGQSAGMVKKRQSARDMLVEITAEAEALLSKGLSTWAD